MCPLHSKSGALINNEPYVADALRGARINQYQIVILLIESGCDVSYVDTKGKPALYYAVKQTNYHLIHTLISTGKINMNFMVNGILCSNFLVNRHVLHIFSDGNYCFCGCMKILKFLLASGMNIMCNSKLHNKYPKIVKFVRICQREYIESMILLHLYNNVSTLVMNYL